MDDAVPQTPSEEAAPDQEARRRIGEELGSTLFVEAGAGSGKTRSLVQRVVRLVITGEAELQHIAAITFTEKAASELADRVRQALQQQAEIEPDPTVRRRCDLAIDQLDGAAIGTLHAFAQRILSEHPVEAGLPPRVEVLDEVSSSVEFERRWSSFRDELLGDPRLRRTLLLLFACGVRLDALRTLALAFDDNWDLVDERVDRNPPEAPAATSVLSPVLDEIDAICLEPCSDPADKLRVCLDDIAAYSRRLRAIDDEVDLVAALHESDPRPPSFKVGTRGKPANFVCDLTELRERIRNAGDRLDKAKETIAAACAERVAAELRTFTLAAAAERRAAGQLEFHDLLVLARTLLRDPEHGGRVRTRLHQRYRRLLLDEFQDTDPIQIELAVRIAAADPASDQAGSAPWWEVPISPGHLFVVGDPKQSIYRFRRADIRTFVHAQRRLGHETGSVVELTANFRSVAPVIGWVNQTFASLMSLPSDIDLPVDSQPAYLRLDAVRERPAGGPAVSVVGRVEHPKEATADELRAYEADDVADVVTRAVAEGWTVGDGDEARPARLGDIAILVPARTSLPFLEDALQRAGIAFRAESSSLVYASRAVRDVVMVLRAVDDPTDALRIVSALRSPLFGCGDDDLFRFKVEASGSWNYLAPCPEGVAPDDPVRAGLAYLRSLHDQRWWQAPSELLERIVRDRCAFELGFAEGRPRDVWRRLRFVIDQARAWTDAATQGESLRGYLRWIDQQASESGRVAEAVLPETDDDAVRILTIHGAKGLEFPITIVSGMSTLPSARPAPAQVVFPPHGTVGYRFGRNVKTQEFDAWTPIDEQMALDERVRLLYVACTRAEDHLVVSLHRRARASEAAPTRATNAELLVLGMGDELDGLPDAAEAGHAVLPLPAPQPSPPPPYDVWTEARDEALRRSSRQTAVAATALTEEGGPDVEPDPGLQKRARDLDLPPWLKGRYGTAIGRAVHGVLQTIDLRTGAGIDAAVAAQCEAEAVPERARDVRRLVDAALLSPSVQEAATSPHWREVYTCTSVGERLLEGYVDLLYRDADGLVVVDYKTAATSSPNELDRRVDGYRTQGASYAVAVEASAGQPVHRVVFVFLTPDGAVERDVADLDAAREDVLGLIRAGRESLVEEPAAG